MLYSVATNPEPSPEALLTDPGSGTSYQNLLFELYKVESTWLL